MLKAFSSRRRDLITVVTILVSLLLAGLVLSWRSSFVSANGPRLVCDTASPGDVVYIQGEGFSPGAAVEQLRWDGVVVPWGPAGLTVGGDGRFQFLDDGQAAFDFGDDALLFGSRRERNRHS